MACTAGTAVVSGRRDGYGKGLISVKTPFGLPWVAKITHLCVFLGDGCLEADACKYQRFKFPVIHDWDLEKYIIPRYFSKFPRLRFHVFKIPKKKQKIQERQTHKTEENRKPI